MVEQIRQHSFGVATEKFKEGAREFKDAISETATGSFEHYCDSGADMIKASPYKSVLIAFGVGALFGLLLFRD
jgi:ElaB/YqjD/DUF883 family membrane-anchored ribosome-binding protein